MDIMLDLERLKSAQTGLSASISAFADAGSTNNALENAIGRPDDRSSLRDKASDFEAAWHKKRDKLLERLRDIEGHIGAIITEWNALDVDSAKSLEGTNAPSTTQNRAV